MVLIQDFDAQPEAEVEGVHFQMKAPSGETIRCSIDPDVFKERLTIDSDANRLGYFSTHSDKFFDIARNKYESGSSSDAQIHIRFRDVHFRDLPERE